MSSQDTNILNTYDMYVLDNGGIPLFAGCTISDYCKEHMEEHPLHTGFIAAIRSFGNEVFSGYPEKLNFGHLKLTFKNEEKYTIVFVNPETADDVLIKTKINLLSDMFKKKYEKNIEYFYVSDEQTDAFVTDMMNLGILPKDRDHLKLTKEIFITDKGQSSAESVSFFGQFKKKLFSMVKK